MKNNIKSNLPEIWIRIRFHSRSGSPSLIYFSKRDGVYELTVSQKPEDSIEAILHRAIKGTVFIYIKIILQATSMKISIDTQ